MVDLSKIEEYRKESLLYNDEAKKYAECMRDIVERMLLLKDYAAIPPAFIPDKHNFEFMCLQFRIIIELIFLSSLAAHKKYYKEAANKLKKEWRPSYIKKFLENINPNFYPVPMELEFDFTKGGYIINPLPESSGFISKKDLFDAYNICNNYLHAKNPFAKAKDYNKTPLR